MILLKNSLGLTFLDVLSLKINARVTSKNNDEISPPLAKKILDWNKSDAALYKHFKAKFFKKVSKFGVEKFKAELKTLQKYKELVSEICVAGTENHRLDGNYIKRYLVDLE